MRRLPRAKVAILTLCLVVLYSCQTAPKPRVRGGGVVVSTQHLASAVGKEILDKGGNAVDAAVAVSFALAVVYPEAGNIGGGGFLVMRRSDGFATTLDFREKAPGQAHRDMYLDESGEVIPGLSRVGALAVGVPGSVAGMLYVLDKYGSMSRKEVIEPAVRLAREGFTLEHDLGGPRFQQFPSTHRVFNRPDGSPHKEGELFKQPDLAKTLEEVIDKGSDGFYRGWVADNIVSTMQKHGGMITHADLEAYQPVEREPVRGTYRGYEIISMPPPSSGGICLIQLLNLLEAYDIAESGWNSAETIHLLTEAQRRIYADRSVYLGDADFFPVPVEELTSKQYAATRASTIDTERATPSSEVAPGDITLQPYESPETTHYSIIDGEGTAVSVTTTLNSRFGSYLVVEGSGFLLNNEMDDFSVKPGVPNQFQLLGNDANAVAPHKRMLSSMTPTIVVEDDRTHMVIGSPGGSTIITTVLQCILNVIDHKMSIEEAVNASRIHHQWYPDVIKSERALPRPIHISLSGMGHSFKTVKKLGEAHGILWNSERGTWEGAADRRGAMAGVSYGARAVR